MCVVGGERLQSSALTTDPKDLNVRIDQLHWQFMSLCVAGYNLITFISSSLVIVSFLYSILCEESHLKFSSPIKP